MIAKLTSKNQLTLPKALMNLFPDVQYFDVAEDGGKLILTPVSLQRGDAVREKLAELGIDPAVVRDAVRWARRKK
jgi:hypothetical protein